MCVTSRIRILYSYINDGEGGVNIHVQCWLGDWKRSNGATNLNAAILLTLLSCMFKTLFIGPDPIPRNMLKHF